MDIKDILAQGEFARLELPGLELAKQVAKDAAKAFGPQEQVSRGLNLYLKLKHPFLMPFLLAAIWQQNEQTRAALQRLNFVHFARFLPLRDQSALMVITEFDGTLDSYVGDFVIAIGDVFDAILGFVDGAEHLIPVREHAEEFIEYVRENNQVFIAPGIPYFPGDYPLYSAYPDLTVVDILGRRTVPAAPSQRPASDPIELDDVQGNLLKGYNAAVARHFALRFPDSETARAFLQGIVVGGDAALLPQVTAATRWAQPPLYCMNIGLTVEGLQKLGVGPALLQRLPRAFVEGPDDPTRAALNGDTGASTPEGWELGQQAKQPVDVLLSLYAKAGDEQQAEFERRTAQLRNWWQAKGVAEVICHEARALPEGKVHFGYRDGIAQPRIESVPVDSGPDMQPRASVGEFLLGTNYISVYGGSSLGLMPAQLCENGTFAAVRVLDQDVDGFEAMLDEAARKTGRDKEFIAAKLMGRWRDGTPLSAAAVPLPVGTALDEVGTDFNEFDYAPSFMSPVVVDDHAGLVCPVGSHMRRMNPRSGRVAGQPYSHRLIRRGMPYEIAAAGGTKRRGLYGIFLCADLERQFEFLMREWANGDSAASGIRGTQDPIIGAQNRSGQFLLPLEDGSTVPIDVPRLVTTRGSLYLLMPGLAALRRLARGDGFEEARKPAGPAFVEFEDGTKMRFHPPAFDPKDPKFLANPYPYYRAFRQAAPVSLVKHGKYSSYWVFSHDLVTSVCDDESMFLKQPPQEKGTRGLFFMDPPRHEQVRGLLDPMFARAIENVEEIAKAQAQAALAEVRQGRDAVFDLIPEYSNRVTRNVFMTMFGVPEGKWAFLGGQIDTILKHYDRMLPLLQRAPAGLATGFVLAYFMARRALCPVHKLPSELFAQMAADARQGRLRGGEVIQSALHFALGGYLSTDFLVGTAIHNLLSRKGALATWQQASDTGRTAALQELMRFDAPFQMADRFAADDTRLGDCPIPRGHMVTVVYGAANRDEQVFARPDELDLTRRIPGGENYVFGHGIHRCIGASMAPKVARIAIDTLLQAMPALALAHGVPERYQDPYFRGFSSLPLLQR